MATGGRARAGRGAALAAAALNVLVVAGCGVSQVAGARPGGAQLRRTPRAWSGFPAGVSPRPLVLAGPDVADPPTGFRDSADRLAYLERAVRFRARLSVPNRSAPDLITVPRSSSSSSSAPVRPTACPMTYIWPSSKTVMLSWRLAVPATSPANVRSRLTRWPTCRPEP